MIPSNVLSPFVSCGMSFLSCGSEDPCGADGFPLRAESLGVGVLECVSRLGVFLLIS